VTHSRVVTIHSAPRAVSGPLLLADISGYTSFLQSVAVAHADDAFADGAIPDAYAMMTDLLDGIVGRVVPPFTLSKLEGDAVFAFAVGSDEVPVGAAMIGCFTECYQDFRRRLGEARSIWTCHCHACSRVDTLDLKFILHAGPFVIQAIAGSDELVGSEVVMAHRLLKTDAAERVGSGACALLTEAAASAFGVPTADAISHVETYEHYEPIHIYLYALRR
jgi:Protein of unknown function (DUF2652)